MSRCFCGKRKACTAMICDLCAHAYHKFTRPSWFCHYCLEMGWMFEHVLRNGAGKTRAMKLLTGKIE